MEHISYLEKEPFREITMNERTVTSAKKAAVCYMSYAAYTIMQVCSLFHLHSFPITEINEGKKINCRKEDSSYRHCHS
jgi:hypothetical protein